MRRLLVVLVVVAMVAGAGWLVFVSSVLAVEQVQVTGARTVSSDRIAAAAAVPAGEPLARVDVDRVRERVEEVPVVARADIGRSWPHTVSIDVTERTPVAAVRDAGRYRLTDENGVLFRTVPEPPRGLPVMQVGSRARAADEAAAVVAALPRKLAARVDVVRATTMDSIELELRDGRVVMWGSAESSALKAEVLGALIGRKTNDGASDGASDRASVYDVSVPSAPTIRVD